MYCLSNLIFLTLCSPFFPCKAHGIAENVNSATHIKLSSLDLHEPKMRFATWMNWLRRRKSNFKIQWRNVKINPKNMFAKLLGKAECLPNQLPSFVCVSLSVILTTDLFFFLSFNLCCSSWQMKRKQPHSKINTAILSILTFHSAISGSLCFKPFHFTLRGEKKEKEKQNRFLVLLCRWTAQIVGGFLTPQSFLPGHFVRSRLFL